MPNLNLRQFERLTEENQKFLRLMLTIAPPVILQGLLNASVNLVDTVMIGRGMGIVEIAAVGLVNQITFWFMLMVFGVLSGASILNGQYFGKGDMSSMHKIMGICFIWSMTIAIIIAIPSILMPQAIMQIFSRDPEVIAAGAIFLRITSISFFLR